MSTSTSTSKKRSRTTVPSSRSTSVSDPRLALTKAINALTNNISKLLTSREDFEDLQESILKNLELELDDFKRRRKELDVEYEQAETNKRIKLNQELDEHGYQRALSILQKRGETAIPVMELDALRDEVKMLRTKDDQELQSALAEAQAKHRRNLEHQLKLKELENKAKEAEMSAQNQTLVKQLEQMSHELDKSEERLAAQRELMKDIAQSQSKPSIVQNVGRD